MSPDTVKARIIERGFASVELTPISANGSKYALAVGSTRYNISAKTTDGKVVAFGWIDVTPRGNVSGYEAPSYRCSHGFAAIHGDLYKRDAAKFRAFVNGKKDDSRFAKLETPVVTAEQFTPRVASTGSPFNPEDFSAAALRLVDYIKSLPDFVYHKVGPGYGHMGATIADSILQANNRYETHVKPRIQTILTRWPNETTVTAVLDLLKSISTTQYLNWRGQDRADRFCDVLRLLKMEGVESESDLRSWLGIDANLSKLNAIRGIGSKTLDYFKIMAGLQGTAIDRRILKFLGMAGIPLTQNDYDMAQSIVNAAADLAGLPRSDFDHSIWRYDGDQEGL